MALIHLFVRSCWPKWDSSETFNWAKLCRAAPGIFRRIGFLYQSICVCECAVSKSYTFYTKSNEKRTKRKSGQWKSALNFSFVRPCVSFFLLSHWSRPIIIICLKYLCNKLCVSWCVRPSVDWMVGICSLFH